MFLLVFQRRYCNLDFKFIPKKIISIFLDFFFAKMTRTFFVGGNWKMNGSKAMIDTIAENLNQTKVPQNVEGISTLKQFLFKR